MQSKPKKILFLITKSNWGGAQRYVYDLATSCAHEYEVVVVHGGTGPLMTKLQAANIRTIAIKNLIRDISLTKEINALREIYTIIKQERPDILHINSSKAGFYGAVIGRLLRIQHIVFTAHGWAFNEPRSQTAKLFFRLVHWLTVWMTHTTIAVSDKLKEQLKIPFGGGKLMTVPLAIRPPVYLLRDEARAQLAPSLPPDSTWLGTIAELHPVKNHRLIIEALPKILEQQPNCYYIVAGDGELRQELENLAAKLNVSEHIVFFGHLPEAASYMKAFDIFLLPSLTEAAGYVLHEAAHAEVPIIASRVGGIPELITDKETGLLLPPNDPSCWQKAILRSIQEPSVSQQYAGSLHHKVQTYSLDEMIRSTQAIYRA